MIKKGISNKNPFMIYYLSCRFLYASGLLAIKALIVWQSFRSVQSPHVVTPLFKAHWRILQRLSQYTVFTPSTRQPSQLICSGRIGAWFNSAHSSAVFFLQSLVIMNCGKISITLFAVQTAIRNHILHRYVPPDCSIYSPFLYIIPFWYPSVILFLVCARMYKIGEQQQLPINPLEYKNRVFSKMVNYI